MTTRNLQITIYEAPEDLRRAGRPGSGRGSDPEGNYVKPPPDDPDTNYVKPPPDGSDPSGNYVKPPPDDPDTNYVKPPPDDPEGNYVKPPPDDTGAGGLWGGASPWAYGPRVDARYLPEPAHAGGCGCDCCCDEKGKLPERPCIEPGDHSGFVIVRLAAGVGPLTAESLWELAEASRLDGLLEVLRLPLDGEELAEGETDADSEIGPDGEPILDAWPHEPEGALRSAPLIQLPGYGRAATVNAIHCLEVEAARGRFRPRNGLARYWRMDLRPCPDLTAEVLERLEALAEVDLAYRELRARDTAAGASARGDVLAADQGYFDPAPVGIGARWALEQIDGLGLGDSSALTLVDLEQGWTVRHLELRQRLSAPGDRAKALDALDPRNDLLLHGENRGEDVPGAGEHGTAVLGQLAAGGVGEMAVRGSAAGFSEFFLASHYREAQDEPTRENPFPGTNGHVASAIVACLVSPAGSSADAARLGAGDILLLEVQRGRLPTETDEADLDAIRLATALGTVVIEAAGNGGYDLDRCDDPRTGRTLRRGAAGFVDSGAVLVGAAFSELPHDRAPFSNYGSRVDCYGWGEGVTTCGYGDLHDGGQDPEQYYTNTFNGTSSAAPIVAGAAAILQCLHEELAGSRLLPLPMRALLSSRATGTPQGPNVGGHIGVMPDLAAIVRGALQLAPDVYIRKSPCDDGSPRGPGDAISSSPDLAVFGTPLANPERELGEGSASAGHPAPGESRDDGGAIYVRVRNRGLRESAAQVQLFASPTATWIGPDAWRPVGATSIQEVPVGGRLAVASAASWPTPDPDPDWPSSGAHTYSFLAIFDPDGGDLPAEPSRALPPGPPWFDWRSYLDFLRGSGVAWRNVHAIPAGSGADLAFFVAGAPDRAREFALEVIQRLPSQAEVRLHLPPALAALLRQRRPEVGGKDGDLVLPRRRTLRFSGLRLPCGLRAPARFEVTAGHALETGHSLALRQLWRGEEVGRITWCVS